MRDDGEQRYSGSSIVLNMASLVKKSSIVEVESLDQLLGKRLDDDGSGEQEKTRDEIKYLLSRTLREPGFDEASRFPHALECPIREISGQYGMSKSRHLETTSCVVSYQGRLLRISRPAISYTKLIRLALSKCKRGCMVLGEIYDFITGHFPYYRYAGAGWKNSVRHSLSTSREFLRIPKTLCISGKGSEWCLRDSDFGRKHLSTISPKSQPQQGVPLNLQNGSKVESIEEMLSQPVISGDSQEWPDEFRGLRPNTYIGRASKPTALEFFWQQPVYTELDRLANNDSNQDSFDHATQEPPQKVLKRDTMFFQEEISSQEKHSLSQNYTDESSYGVESFMKIMEQTDGINSENVDFSAAQKALNGAGASLQALLSTIDPMYTLPSSQNNLLPDQFFPV